jgi:hypothetical protein
VAIEAKGNHMTGTRRISLATSLLLLATTALPAGADPKAGAREELQRRETLKGGLPRGAPFLVQGRTYQLVGGLRAVPGLHAERPPDTLRRVGAAAGDLVESKGPYLLLRQGDLAAHGAVLRHPTGPTHPVAVNRATGQLAVLPGELVVRPRSFRDLDALAADHGLVVASRAPSIGAAFLVAPEGRDLVAAAAALAADSRLLSAEVEVLEQVPEAQ